MAILIVVGLACGAGETPAPKETGSPPESPQAEGPSTVGPSSGPVSTGSMMRRPSSVEDLVARAGVIVLGTIDSVLEERQIGPYYGEHGKPLPVGEEGGIPVTDYQVQIESVLKGDGALTDGGTLVLRMFGHLSDQNATITSAVFTLPNPGDRLLFSLGRNPDGTYGSGPDGLLNIDGEKVAYADGVPFAAEISPDQLMRDIRDAPANSSEYQTAAVEADECNPANDILSCFTDGRSFANMPVGEYWDLFLEAREDLSERTGLDIGTIKLMDIASKEWSDTSLGNPKPGMMYAQVITPGFIMVLDAGGPEDYVYHTSMHRVVYVEAGDYDGLSPKPLGKDS